MSFGPLFLPSHIKVCSLYTLQVRVKGPRYWTAEFKVGANWDALK